MAICATRPESGFYPNLFRTSTALHQITAANRDRLHALGPWTGGNESAARRRLRLLQRPPQASTRHSDVLSEVAAMSMSTRECRFTPSARMVMPTLAGVLRVDSRWPPTTRTRRAMPAR